MSHSIPSGLWIWGVKQERRGRLDTGSLNPLWKPGEDPAALPWPGLALIDHFPPSSLHLAPATLWGLPLQGAFWANPLQKRKPLLGFVLLNVTCSGTGSALPIFGGRVAGGAAGQSSRGKTDSFQQMVQRG